MTTIERGPPDFDSLPEWARLALDKPSRVRPLANLSEDLRNASGWPLLLDAAVVSTFLPKDLAPDSTNREERSDAEKLVLRYSQAAYTSTGSAAWELTRDVRETVLRTAIRRDEIRGAILRTSQRFSDAISEALRATLTGTPVATDSMELGDLEARRAATALVSGVSEVQLPTPLNELDRNIRQRRLVEQFERMCGKDFERRIVGRAQELEDLRGYVGSIAASSATAFAVRGFRAARRAITGRPPYVIWGTGGVGKTTLIARFMLEHIRKAESNFPFAYLDFDRPSVSPSDPFGLFGEICLQVSAQFPELDEPMRKLRDRIYALQPAERSPNGSATVSLAPLAAEFRERIDDFLDERESYFEWARPFLLMLDTFEIVQYDANQVELLEMFMRMLAGSEVHQMPVASRADVISEALAWPRMRLIISGRKQVMRFIGAAEVHELEGVDAAGAMQLLHNTADESGKPISATSAEGLVNALAIKRSRFATPRVHPLRVRMMAHIFKTSSLTNGDSIATTVIEEVRSGVARGNGALQALVDGILVRRIISHVTDERVRLLANPGLVVRLITPNVIREVMAHGSPPPGQKDPGDVLNFDPWDLSQTDAEAIFSAFAKELTLVEADGAALRHRQDVRAEMLPLIRANTPKRFEHLHQLAFRYFERLANGGDSTATAEAIYHGLWSGEALEKLDSMWQQADLASPRIDPEEFSPDSLASIYLRARNREGLTTEEISRLPQPTAVRWAISFGELFLLSTRPEESLDLLRAATGNSFQALESNPATAAIAARLLYRAGLWGQARDLTDRASPDKVTGTDAVSESAWISITRLRAALAAKMGASEKYLLMLADHSANIRDPLALTEILASIVIGGVRIGRPDIADAKLRERLRQVSKATGESTSVSLPLLRLAILTTGEPDPALVLQWLRRSDRLPQDSEIAPIIAELPSLAGQRRTAGLVQVRDQLAAGNRRLLLSALRIIAYDHSDWHKSLGNALARDLEADEKLRELLVANKFVAARRGSADVTIVFTAVRDGRFLELVRLLADYRRGPATCPDTAAGLAQALIDWHATLLKMVEAQELASNPKATPVRARARSTDSWAISWTIVHSDLDIAHITGSLTDFTFHATNAESQDPTYELAHNVQVPSPDWFAGALLRPVGEEQPSFWEITHTEQLPFYSRDTATQYAYVSDILGSYFARNTGVKRLEGIIRVPLTEFRRPHYSPNPTDKSSLIIKTLIHFYQFPGVIEGGLPLLVVRTPLSPFNFTNGDGTAMGIGKG